jgi:hypothetical protein
VFADMAAMFLSAFFAWIFFGLTINAEFVTAIGICSSSVALYYGVMFDSLPRSIPAKSPEPNVGNTEIELRPLITSHERDSDLNE